MAEDNVNIQMRLATVSEVSFMMSPGKVGDNVNPDAIQIGFSTQIQPDVKNNIFNLIFGTRYELDGDLVLESLYKFEFEVKDLRQFIVFNDNQSITVNHIMPHFLSVAVGTMREAVKIIDTRALTEASGNVTLDNIAEVGKAGVDIISMGALTHSVKAFDISMKIAK